MGNLNMTSDWMVSDGNSAKLNIAILMALTIQSNGHAGYIMLKTPSSLPFLHTYHVSLITGE